MKLSDGTFANFESDLLTAVSLPSLMRMVLISYTASIWHDDHLRYGNSPFFLLARLPFR